MFRKMEVTNLIKKILIFISGLFIMGFGVALSVKADLGVSPISCTPYVFSLKFPFTLGELTIIFNGLLILMQVILLRRRYRLIQLAQLPAVIVFGYFIDFSLNILSDLNTHFYFYQLVLCLLSCMVLAFGIFIILKADVICLPGEGLAIAIVDTFEKEFGKIKIWVDSSMVIIGALSSFILIQQIEGIGEGTVVAALLVGYFIKFYRCKFVRAYK